MPEAPKPVGVQLSGAEWALVLESLRRFALDGSRRSVDRTVR